MMNHNKITKEMLIGDILRFEGNLAPLLMEMGMHCLGCPSSQMESLEEACFVHGVDPDAMILRLNEELSAQEG